MRAGHLALAVVLLTALAGCSKGPQGDSGPFRTSRPKGGCGPDRASRTARSGRSSRGKRTGGSAESKRKGREVRLRLGLPSAMSGQ